MITNKEFKITAIILIAFILFLTITRQGYEYSHYEYYDVVFFRIEGRLTTHFIPYSQLSIYILPFIPITLLVKRIVTGVSNFSNLDGKLNIILSSVLILVFVYLLLGVENYDQANSNIHTIQFFEGKAFISIMLNIGVLIYFAIEARRKINKSLFYTIILAISTVVMAAYVSLNKIYWFILFLYLPLILIVCIMLIVDRPKQDSKLEEKGLDYI